VKKSTKSSRRRQPRSKRSKREPAKSPVQGVLHFREMIREVLMGEIRSAVTKTAEQLVKNEVQELVGAPWSRKGESPLRRGGSCQARIFLEGEPVHIERPRVRDKDAGVEYPLETVQALTSRDALDGDVMRLMAVGVSTRNYEPALGKISDGLGLKRSAVSSAFKRASQKDLDALNGRPLGEWTFVSVFIDGTSFAEHTCVVALGVTQDGSKKILGIREGATENSVLVSDLLADLVERGLELTRRALFVLDGSKALAKGVRDVFGKQAIVQRCVLHKARNVISYLPPKWQADARRRLNAAWNMTHYEDAKDALVKVLEWLTKINESAAASLREGFEDTLTVHRLGVTGTLRKTLITTNPIESAFDIVVEFSRRVKRWNGSSMVLRWVGSGLVQAESQFRRVKGYKAIPELIVALDKESLNDVKDVA
jgi:putative transposase